jgi:hypothetical protein
MGGEFGKPGVQEERIESGKQEKEIQGVNP